MANLDYFLQVLDKINDIKEDVNYYNNQFDNEINELDFESDYYNLDVQEIEERRAEQIGELETQIPNVTFQVVWSDDDIETINAYDLYKEDSYIPIEMAEKIYVID